MFGSSKPKEDPKKTPLPASATGGLNTLVKGTIIDGSVKSESDIRVDGSIKGKLSCNAKVIIGPTGSIEGEITCQNAVIEGRFKGTLHVQELLLVKDSADIEGDIQTAKLTVQSGAKFNVKCHMDTGHNAGNSMKNQDANVHKTTIAGQK